MACLPTLQPLCHLSYHLTTNVKKREFVLYDCPLRYAAELCFEIRTAVRFIAAGTAALLCSPSGALAASSGTDVLYVC
jgi:hypothetical protein